MDIYDNKVSSIRMRAVAMRWDNEYYVVLVLLVAALLLLGDLVMALSPAAAHAEIARDHVPPIAGTHSP